MTDNLTGIFDDIDPSMFALSTSAVHEEAGDFVGVDAFNAFTDESLRSVRTAFASSFGQINPIAILANAKTRRHFAPQQDENLGQFLERLKREAVLMGAHWFFLAKRNQVAVWYDDDVEVGDVGSSAAHDKAVQAGSQTRMAMLWYSERREGSETHHRHGALEIVGHQLAGGTEGDGTQTLGVFSLILDAVRH